METSNIDFMAYIINHIGVFFALFLFMGVAFKLGMIFSAIGAYPVYLALFAVEYVLLPSKKSSGKHLLKLNIPKKVMPRNFMNVAATFVTIFMIPNFIKLYEILNGIRNNEISAANGFINYLMGFESNQLLSNGLAIFLILIVYIISYFTTFDERSAVEKIETLSVPSLWSGIFKSAS
ncbi:hypothetical protein [Aliivibrio fischeri]|uniref:hypothetical protein n=1 Tax=Aliivibrio fischeri TaxID=668 RepID=UPI0007C53AD2|nr:hypothetical protein [Aliivibrio fischeri]